MGKSRIETILEKFLGGDGEIETPQSRTEALLVAILENRMPQFVLCSASKDKQEVAANSRVLVELDLPLPDGYEILAHRNVIISKATGATGDAHKLVGMQYYSTAGGGKKSQVPLINHGDSDALVKIDVKVIAVPSDSIKQDA